jgi:hypothetical protein
MLNVVFCSQVCGVHVTRAVMSALDGKVLPSFNNLEYFNEQCEEFHTCGFVFVTFLKVLITVAEIF